MSSPSDSPPPAPLVTVVVAIPSHPKAIAVLPLDTLTDRVPIRIRYAPYDLAVVRLGDEVFALEDACNHSSASLSEGFVQGDCLVCPAHGFVFSLRTGALVRPEGRCDDQRRYPVRIVGAEIFIDASDPEPLQ